MSTKRFASIARKLIWAAGGIAVAKLLLGISVPLPDSAVVARYVEKGGAPLLAFYNYLGGGALAKGSALALGIMPYLSARAFMALARRSIPVARALDRARERWWTRGLTVGIAVVQSMGYATFTENLPGAVSEPGLLYTGQMVLMLTTVSTLLMLFAEEATSAGEEKVTPLLPREKPLEHGVRAVRDPVYISHPTPVP